jgi:hypothetical protein
MHSVFPGRQFHPLKNTVSEGNLRTNEPIDAREAVRYTTSEANSRAAVTKFVENHRKFDSAQA